MNYIDFITPIKSASRSINIQFDIHNLERINRFVPTTSLCEVMKVYLRAALGESDDHSITLVGPYGKGKSFLTLVLAEIMSQKDLSCLDVLLEKIHQIDSELFDLIHKYHDQKINLLPVMIEGSYQDLEQAFYISLRNALKRENLDDDLLETTFTSAIEVFEIFESADAFSSEKVTDILLASNTDLKKLKSGLENFDRDALNRFRKIVSAVTYGMDLDLTAGDNPIKVYEMIVRDLSKIGWNGLFVIFDEFSKAMEGTTSEITNRLKTIQDFAELSNRSTVNQQILFTCITHKTMDLYAAGKSEAVLSSFRAVEGRFKEIKLNKNSQESLQLLALSFTHQNGYQVLANRYVLKNQDSFEKQATLGVANYSQIEYAAKNLFPMVPLVAFLLIQLSEVAAQNERTMFTALSDSSPASFSSFLKTNYTGLFTSDHLFDYFEEQLYRASEKTAELVRKSRAAFMADLSPIEEKTLKTVALLLAVEDFSTFRSVPYMIAALLDEDVSNIEEALNELEEKGILRTDLLTNEVFFQYGSSKVIQEEINREKVNSITRDELENEINLSLGEKFYLPQRYNLRYRILRYFDSRQFDLDEFLSFYPEPEEYKNVDGLFLNIYTGELKLPQKEAALNHFSKITEIYPALCMRLIEFDWLVYRSLLEKQIYSKRVLEKGNLTSLVKDELQQIVLEQTGSLRKLLRNGVSKAEIIYVENGEPHRLPGSHKNAEEALSRLCEKIYSNTPIINNELIVRHKLSDNYTKAVRYITDGIIAGDLSKKIETVSDTSPEKTVYRALFDEHGLRKTVDQTVFDIQRDLLRTYEMDPNIELSQIINRIRKIPYGVREGVIPPLLAQAIVSLGKNPILYYQGRQIELNCMNLEKAVHNSTKYSLYFSRNDETEKRLLDSFVSYFSLPSTGSFYKKADQTMTAIKNRRNKLPMIIRESSKKNNPLSLSPVFLEFNSRIKRFDINTYDFLFGFLLKRFDNDPASVIDFIDSLAHMDQELEKFVNSITSQISEKFGGDCNDSIRSAYLSWVSTKGIDINSIVLDGNSNRLNTLFKSSSFDNSELLSQISKITTGYHIMDWSTDNSAIIMEEIDQYIKNAEAARKEPVREINSGIYNKPQQEMSLYGNLLKNAVQSSMEEFGGSVTNAEKIQILEELIASIQNGGIS